MELGKYSFGIGDRFALQGRYQLKPFLALAESGVVVTPVWNKSNREHQTVGSQPPAVRAEADAAVSAMGWKYPYFVDADHITMETVDDFLETSDFFTIDVANKINTLAEPAELETMMANYLDYQGTLKIPGLADYQVTAEDIYALGQKFLKATEEASAIYRKIKAVKPEAIIEISMDEVEHPQTPVELFFILGMLSDFGVQPNTIAPKFIGRFNKGVDYEGDIRQFEIEFEQDLLVLSHAVKIFGLPTDLKLSVHTGSDKFSLYPVIGRLIRKHDLGVHIKTAGTTWLEELIGLAESGKSGLAVAKEIYRQALDRREELTVAYSTVLNIDPEELPSVEVVEDWHEDQFVAALRHDTSEKTFNPSFRQLLHTAYKVAAEMGGDYINTVKNNEVVIGRNVTYNILEKHLKPIFLS